MFRRLPEALDEPVSLTMNGHPIQARSTDSVAAALLAAGMRRRRDTAVSGALRGAVSA